jgi:hypothetical protein
VIASSCQLASAVSDSKRRRPLPDGYGSAAELLAVGDGGESEAAAGGVPGLGGGGQEVGSEALGEASDFAGGAGAGAGVGPWVAGGSGGGCGPLDASCVAQRRKRRRGGRLDAGHDPGVDGLRGLGGV